MATRWVRALEGQTEMTPIETSYGRRAACRVLTLAAAVDWRRRLRAAGASLAVTNGCFELLHAGHVAMLAAAAREADALLVLVNSDASVAALKGDGRPVNRCEDRMLVLASLRGVSAVVAFEGRECAAELAALAPDVYVKSREYEGRQNAAEAAALAQCGARVVWIDRLPGRSTTAVLARMAGRIATLPAAPPDNDSGGPGECVPPAAGGMAL